MNNKFPCTEASISLYYYFGVALQTQKPPNLLSVKIESTAVCVFQNSAASSSTAVASDMFSFPSAAHCPPFPKQIPFRRHHFPICSRYVKLSGGGDGAKVVWQWPFVYVCNRPTDRPTTTL